MSQSCVWLCPNSTLAVAILNDPTVFENPTEFNPERYVKSEFGTLPGKDEDFRDSFIFGGGRVSLPFVNAICSSQRLAAYLSWAVDCQKHNGRLSLPPRLYVFTYPLRSKALATMRLLWGFDFSNAVDSETKKVVPPGLQTESFEFVRCFTTLTGMIHKCIASTGNCDDAEAV